MLPWEDHDHDYDEDDHDEDDHNEYDHQMSQAPHAQYAMGMWSLSMFDIEMHSDNVQVQLCAFMEILSSQNSHAVKHLLVIICFAFLERGWGTWAAFEIKAVSLFPDPLLVEV